MNLFNPSGRSRVPHSPVLRVGIFLSFSASSEPSVVNLLHSSTYLKPTT